MELQSNYLVEDECAPCLQEVTIMGEPELEQKGHDAKECMGAARPSPDAVCVSSLRLEFIVVYM